MTGKTADLHIHTYYSDGTLSPQEIADAAREKGVGLIAVTDHNMLDGSREMKACCEKAGIGWLPGVELDTLNDGRLQHILGYGIDLEDKSFQAFVKENRRQLDRMSVILVERMSADYPGVSPEDLERFSYDRRLGGWKALHYFMARGVTEQLTQGFGLYNRYGCTYSSVGFASVEEACRRVREASGRAVLAHPGETNDTADLGEFKRTLEELTALGLDGIECYYPTHSEEVTRVCADVCREKGLLITAGSDCHGAFGKTSVGQMQAPMERLNLGDMV